MNNSGIWFQELWKANMGANFINFEGYFGILVAK